MKHTECIGVYIKLADLIDSAEYWRTRADSGASRNYWADRVELLQMTKAIVVALDKDDKPELAVKLMEHLKL